ncbi:putative uncharacterized protein DDB_G0281733 isoform X2 [Toxorhynchites rutilus septentrionalis]|nr:putative uncharacterized protein DDB_G0281733 isoform X2 [Toxorhynchites rutilus septentrionalis]
MTRLCGPWSYSQRDDCPADGFAQFLHPSPPGDSKEMDDMLVQCNKNSVYVLNSSYRYRDFDMIELFGSPAGRALAVKNKSAIEMHSCSNANNNSNAASSSSSTATPTMNQPFCQQPLYNSLQNGGFNGTCSTISSSLNQMSNSTVSDKFVESSDIILYRSHQSQPNDIAPHRATNPSGTNRTSSKMAKIWKLFDEDRIHKRGSNNNNSSISGSDIFSRCQSRRKISPIQSEEKSTKDLYNEAAQLLGMKCTLSDSCRCIDCQSQYFDCDDFDSYSEYSDKSYDTEDNFAVNHSYFSTDSSHNLQQEEYNETNSVHSNRQSDSDGRLIIDTNQNEHLMERVNDGENKDDNSNNKTDQYLLHDGIQHSYRSVEVHRNYANEGHPRRDNGNDMEQIQQIESDASSGSVRKCSIADGVNELEANCMLEA